VGGSTSAIRNFIEKNEKDGACKTYEGKQKPIEGFGGET
jgi:hypothetical protein